MHGTRAAKSSDMGRRLFFIFVIFSGLGACGASTEQLKATSAFALSCHESRITYEKVSSELVYASGCGSEATFVEYCEEPLERTHCRWQLSTGVQPAGTRDRERRLANERRFGTAHDPAR